MTTDRLSPPPPCPQCQQTMKRTAYLPSEGKLPAVSVYWCDTCGIEQTFEEDDEYTTR